MSKGTLGGRIVTSIATSALIASLLVAASPIEARAGSSSNFHLSCRFSHARKDDPIVYPNMPGASHLHDFYGNVSTRASSTLKSMRRANTLCSSKADTSGYWSPALLAPDGTVVKPLRLAVYYWHGDGGKVIAPPAGLKMIAGGDTTKLKIAGYACGEGMPVSSVPFDCGRSLLKGVIVFPSCWDGHHLDSRNHRSHMAYPTGKGCPKGYRHRIPKIIFHITYGIQDGTGYTLVSDAGMGMTDGMSLHADFWNTWHQKALVRLVRRCLNGGLICDL
ncbi:MAG: DUF1996 domain-containing protein [Actinobacteria bacterium]|nr:DUF1996 domain-containing protein [Actinomycetota bacterium]